MILDKGKDTALAHIIEVDIWYLTGQYIEMYPARFRKTVRFFDHGGELTRMRKKLDVLQARERANFMTPLPTGVSGFFARWSRGKLIESNIRLEEKLKRKTERRLHAELKSTRDMSVLVRSEYDRSEFHKLDQSGRNRILEVLNDYHRWFVNDWVYLRGIRIWNPETEPAPVLS